MRRRPFGERRGDGIFAGEFGAGVGLIHSLAAVLGGGRARGGEETRLRWILPSRATIEELC